MREGLEEPPGGAAWLSVCFKLLVRGEGATEIVSPVMDSHTVDRDPKYLFMLIKYYDKQI